LPALAYLVVLFLAFGAIPLAFTNNGYYESKGVLGPQIAFLLIPIAVAFYIRRTATFVSTEGVRVRALFGSRSLPWSTVRGLSVQGRSIYAVAADGTLRLPCVRINDLAAVARASGGRLPELVEATPKPAPGGRRHR
jgi:hypothetical protein